MKRTKHETRGTKDFIDINDVHRSFIEKVFMLTDELKKHPHLPLLEGKTLAMIFAKTSTRTRVSFEAGMTQLGGHAIYIDARTSQLGKGETIADTAKTLSRYCDGIMARLFSHKDMLELAKHSSVPVINGLTDLLHPCQAMADLYTIDEKLERLRGVNLAYIGDASNNVCHSLMQLATKLGVNMSIACPKAYAPDKGIYKLAMKNAKVTGSTVKLFTDPLAAAKGADVVYTDTWVSMGQEKEAQKRLDDLRPYQVNRKLMKHAKPFCLFMHCLPAYRGNEVTADVIDGPGSVVFDQAENRLHTQKAIMSLLMNKEKSLMVLERR
jgi:ornithine carbamoyltransferase